MTKLLFILLAIFCLTLLSSCYSFSSSTLPKNIKTITIFPAENNTMQMVLGDDLTENIKNMFSTHARDVKQINNSTHSEFYITLKEYSNKALGFSAEADIQSYQVVILVDVLFKDVVNNEILYEGVDLEGTGEYDASTEDEVTHGQKRAIEDIQQVIINNSLSAW